MGLFGRSFKSQPEDGGSDQEVYDTAALNQLGLRWFINGVMGDVSAEQTAAMRKKIAEKREWVSTLSDANWRSAFNRWLNHAEHCCADADRYREERPKQDLEWAESERKRRAWDDAARELMRSNPPLASRQASPDSTPDTTVDPA